MPGQDAKTMRTVEMRESGGPDVLEIGSRAVPSPAPSEVLIRVAAAGVNGPDLVQRRGHYPPPKGASDLLGLEVSGEIVEVGSDVTKWNVGDKVCALTNGGGYAEYVPVLEGHVLPLPEGIDIIDAAGLCETYFTVWSNVFHGFDIPEGGNFLVHGGSGGIGTTAVQLGAAMGLNVYTTVESAEAAEFVTSLGATRAIRYKDEDFVDICRDAGGMDIILDIIGGDYVARNIKAARHDARLIQLAFNAGSKVEINLMPIMLKRLTYTGSTLRSRSDTFKAQVASGLKEHVWPHFAAGRLRPVTHKTYPLDDAAKAHAEMEGGSQHGKILLRL
ncbi:putative NAD(P)H quinone oxidoreductase, PIG3 family [Poseidonocella pacifica]|uniref:Putative NAD(P)H quinone oxidoreductase, PIG3 family n=1 Tax=Poseidonocella pacifica TaxID=871651 RepID=A0A1I0X1E2_9RHOB|nr:NAD(P)H-quinone oxidoreductase [Poseidonocella pacifica]SFA94654.1 putative NAD(P)H quinone oxidoreductase, PIG3 family [Poseidonocella pacifica]